MGSLLGSTLTKIFLCQYEEQWLEPFPTQFLFTNEQQVNKFEKYLHAGHANMHVKRMRRILNYRLLMF